MFCKQADANGMRLYITFVVVFQVTYSYSMAS